MELAEDSSVGDVSNRRERTVFVGNLPHKVTWRDLKDFSSKFGSVVYAKCVTDFVTRKPKGCGFVEFKSVKEADRARNADDSLLMFKGRLLRIAETKHERKRSPEIKTTPSVDCCDAKTPNKPNSTEEDSSSPSPISILRDDEITKILGFLSPIDRIGIERVCQQWRRCVQMAFKDQKQMVISNRPHHRIQGFSTRFTEQNLYKTLCRGSHRLRSLDLSHVSQALNSKALQIIGKFCKHLEKLDMSGIPSSTKAMAEFTSICTKLKWLSVLHCHLSEKSFWYIFHNCQQLEYLNCAGNSGITGKCFKYATKSFQELHAGNCSKLSSAGIMQLCQRSPKLQTLDVSNCRSLMRQTISSALRSFRHLKELCVGDLSLTASTEHQRLDRLAFPPTLAKLKVYNCGLKDADLLLICSQCPHLCELDISCNELTDVSVTQLDGLSELQFLSICHLPEISNASLMDLVQRGKLRRLRAQCCRKLGDELFLSVANCCLSLEELDIFDVGLVTMETIKAFAQTMSNEPTRKLLLYMSGFSLMDEHRTISVPPGLTIMEDYRRLYPNGNFILLIPAGELQEWLLSLDDTDMNSGLQQDLLDSDDMDLNDEHDIDHDFLVNDDPLALEFFDFS